MIHVFCDGSSGAGGGKPGGWAFVLVRGEEEVLGWNYGGHPSTTNNKMEIEAAIQGLLAAKELGLHLTGEILTLTSDSQYALGMASGAYTPSKNFEEVDRLRKIVAEVGVIQFRWVKGHNGNQYNEHCDKLAGMGKIEATPEHLRPMSKTPKGTARKKKRQQSQ